MDRLFRQWTQDHQDQAWSLARYLLKDASEAEDVVQEAFIRLWEHRDSMSPQRVKPWVLRVTRNLCLDRLRRQQPETDFEDAHIAGGDEPLAGLQQTETGRSLQAAVIALDEPFRSLVLLRDVQQHSYEEVSAMTELSMPQVKTYLHRARKILRQQLQDLRP